MASASRMNVQSGNTTNAWVTYLFIYAGQPMPTSFIQYKVWDNDAYIEFLSRDGVTWLGQKELTQDWQPILIPFSALGFRIMDLVPLAHARFEVTGMA